MAARGSYKSYLQDDTEIPRTTVWRKAPKLRTAPPPTLAGPPTLDFDPHQIQVLCQNTIDSSSPVRCTSEPICGEDDSIQGNSCIDENVANEFPYSVLSVDDSLDAVVNGTLVPSVSIESNSYDSDPSDSMELDGQGVTTQETTDTEGSPSTAPQATHPSSPPIYADAPVTVAVSCLLILTYAMRYSLTGEAIADLLRLIRVHCPSPNQICCSLYRFRQYFQNMKLPVKFHLFCTKCSSLLTQVDASHFVCPNALCKLETTVGRVARNFFLEMDLKQQLQELLGRPEICQEIFTYRFNRTKKASHNLEDVYDGQLYREHFEHGGILSDQRNISLTINTDGIQVFNSPPSTMWPVYFCINELPQKLRMKKENMILAGLWFGRSKPEMLTFLEPFVLKLKELEKGITVENRKFGTFISKTILLIGTYDKPAKCAVQNFTQFNGMYGCGRCLQPGKSIKTSKSGHVHVFPYQASDPTGPPRTQKLVAEYSRKALDSGSAVMGVKGPSWLSCLQYFDVVRGSMIDYMHTVLLGVCRGLLNLWFDSQHHSEPWYIGGMQKEVDSRLASIKPPSSITRTPRSTTERKTWKAHEFRAWLLHYSLPVLQGILPDVYFQHYLLLVHAMYLLLQSSISPEEIDNAEKVLNHFVYLLPVLYSERYMSANIHDLLHLPQCVRDAGPLHVFSCFSFESTNHALVRLIHGTQAVPQQVARGIAHLQCIPVLAKDVVSSGAVSTQALELLERLMEYIFNVDTAKTPLCLGKGQPLNLSENMHLVPPGNSTSQVGALQVHVYQRVKVRNFTLDSEAYTRTEKRINSCVAFHNPTDQEVSYGLIKYFIRIQTENKVLAIINVLLKRQGNLSTDTLTGATAAHIKLVDVQPDEHSIPVESIIMRVVLMKIGSAYYVSEFPNLVESD